jgi:hypothetical protein
VTYHRWRARDGGMKADEVKRLKEAEAENAELKRIWPIRCWSSRGSRSWRRETSEPGASTPGGARVAGPARDVGASGVAAGLGSIGPPSRSWLAMMRRCARSCGGSRGSGRGGGTGVRIGGCLTRGGS